LRTNLQLPPGNGEPRAGTPEPAKRFFKQL
jgi:hypothetical protein